ncbi:MAG: histidinol-phosphate transaminase [Bdellovibrionales bacterium]|nr:histidinol-phosphate transaminase [Oligoflexia bacterium]
MPIQFPRYIEDLKPYISGKPIEETQREYGVKRVTKLASNENPLGPSPKAVLAMKKAMKDLQLYPDASGFALRHAIAKKEGVTFDEVILGNGSNEVIELLLRTFCIPGDSMVASDGVFAAYPISARIQGVETISTRMTQDYRFDLPAMLEQIKKNPRVKIVALPNPNNPTGTYVTDAELFPFLAAVEKVRGGSVHVMLDYAYQDFVTAKDLADPLQHYRNFSHVSVLKTFSKIYGLGGLRVGYGIMKPELAKYVQKVRMPFNVSSMGLVGAEAALEDKVFIKKSIQVNRAGMKLMKQAYEKMGIPFLPSQGNFFLINTRQGFGMSGAEVFEESLKKGMIFRPVTNYGMPDWLRISIGTEAQNKLAVKVLEGIKKSSKV